MENRLIGNILGDVHQRRLGVLPANAFAFLFFFMASGGVLYLSDRTDTFAPVWPAAGAALAMISLFGHRVVPGIFLASFTALHLFAGNLDFGEALVIASVDVAGPALGVAAARLIGVRDPFERVSTLMLFLVVAGIPSAFATVGTSLIVETMNGHLPADRWHDLGLVLLLGQLVGIVTIWPLLESWWRYGVPPRPALLVLIVALIVGFTSTLLLTNSIYFRFIHIAPLIIWASLAYDVRGASLAVALVGLLYSVNLIWQAETVMGVDMVQGRTAFLQQQLLIIGAIALVVGVIDYSRQKKQQDRLSLAADAAGLGFFEANLKTGVMLVDKRIRQILDLPDSKEPIRIVTFLNQLHPDDADALRSTLLHDDRSHATTFTVEPRIDDAASALPRWVSINGRITHERRSMSPTRIMARGSVRDITERKRVERRVRQHERLLRGILDSLAAWVAVVGPDGTVVETNEGDFASLDRSMRGLLGTKIWNESWWNGSADAASIVREAVQAATRDGETSRFDICMSGPDGNTASETFWVDLQIAPLQGAPITGSVVLSGIDITSRRSAEKLSRSLGDIINATPDYVAFGAPDGSVRFLNSGGRRLLSEGGDMSDAYDPVPPEAPNLFTNLSDDQRDKLFTDGFWMGENTLELPDERRIPVSQVLIVHKDDGVVTSLSTIMRDMTEQQRSVERQSLLMRELSHRVKNTLAVIQGMARQTLRTADSPQKFADSFLGRIASLSASHALLTERDWSAPSLREVIHSQLKPLLGADRTVEIAGPKVLLPAETATQFGLVIHELGTNAIKHGALASDDGTLSISWTMGSERKLHFVWKERHSSARSYDDSETTGFGTRLLQMTAIELERRFEIDGLRVTFDLELPAAPTQTADRETPTA
ncbi:HWE histidine kinase domain-containing protein [Notoacmeibacter sp. MSK16QG-6]|uniref:HWE histidine kinase domain-containing protein n=1 Tax=Notoacmeibacter sp. MSK16QG-6 TaxID=2957982 RepID=UPI00209D3E39|nr:HWE histidine kinase domain-containing protein [Notoacmeibacter sp. MSK16QG-6]MCP1200216.1 MASE1 domain-containing protein [Notoacmeibacter sp. MSK16QG-6]